MGSWRRGWGEGPGDNVFRIGISQKDVGLPGSRPNDIFDVWRIPSSTSVS
jgi:hypothetical protein